MKYVFLLLLSLSTFFANSSAQAQSSDSTRLKSQAISAVQMVDDNSRWLEILTPTDLNELPVGLKRTLNNITYKLAVTSAVSYKTHIELTVFARVDIPQNPKTLFFGVSGLKLSHSGEIMGDAKLVLLGDVPINVAGGNGQLILKGDFNIDNGQTSGDLTYITMDCSGFKTMGIAADLIFPRSVIIPCDANGDKILDESKKVMGSFQTHVTDWNNILVNINLPKFQVNALDGLVFHVSNATFDFSDTRNSADVVFPSGYEYRHMTYPNSNMWRGVYIQAVEVTLPKAFRRRGGQRISFGATNFILDNNGITGLLFAKNILPYDEGSASGWKFSVDEFNIGLEANQLVAGGFKGTIGLPVADKDALNYEAIITGDNKYQLMVSPKGQMDFQLWQAKVTLAPNSYVKLLVDNGQFKPEANLYGRFDMAPTLDANSTNSVASFKGITFRGMRIRTMEPYFSVDYLGYEGEVKVAGFPASIDKIALVTTNNNANLAFNLNVTLQDQAFKGSTRLNVHARFENNNGHHHYRFEKVNISAIELKEVKVSDVITLSGSIAFMDNDPVYGNGFGGGIEAKFKTLGDAKVNVRCIFGHTTFRYWFIDGKADFGTAIPLAGALRVDGFAGGAYYRMSKVGADASLMDKQMPSYKPDADAGLGIKAGIIYHVVSRATVNGVAEFEVAFSKGGGLKYVGLFGNARIMATANEMATNATKVLEQAESATGQKLGGSPTAKQKEAAQDEKQKNPTEASKSIPIENAGGISAYVGIMYDFENQSFHANAEVYINVMGGLLQGAGQNYRAGNAVLHFEPGTWYIYIGTPKDPIGINLNIAGMGINTEAYFMLGTKILDSPPPPQEVANILGKSQDELDYMRGLNSSGGTGGGIAFGTKATIRTGDITFLVLYANLEVGLGFDLMLKQYANTTCKGRSGPIGINGWYANAQAYAYLKGEFGIKVDLWFIKARIPIVAASAAVLVQAQLPNPSWFQGNVGLNVSVLGGLISGRMNFQLTLGEKCEIMRENPNPLNMDVISDFSPHSKTDVDVFAAPQVTFNFPVDKDVEIDSDQGKKNYRIVLEQFEMHHESKTGKKAIEGDLQWNASKDAVSFHAKDILPPSAKVTAMVRVSFKEQKGGTWQPVYMNGKKSEEVKTLVMTTGTAPETIPLRNVQYAWPVVNQNHFYLQENNQQGIIKLRMGQPNLFSQDGFKQELTFEPTAGGPLVHVPFAYDGDARCLRFSVDQLQADTEYELAITAKPTTGTATDAAPKTTQEETNYDADNSLRVTKLHAQDVQRTDVGKVILSYSFKCSQFGTFREKMTSINYVKSIWQKTSSDVISLQQRISGGEPFDKFDLKGSEHTDDKPLVQPVAMLDDAYFREDIYPVNYKNYPLNGNIHITNRDTTVLGLIPAKALPIVGNYLSLAERDNFSNALIKMNLPYLYDLPRVYKADFSDLQNQAANRFLGKPELATYNWLINGSYPFIRKGRYKVNYQYVIPGNVKGTSYVVEYDNEIE